MQEAVAFAIGETAQSAEPIRASITVVEQGALWRASIVTEAPHSVGTRELEGASCQEVTAAAVVVLSLLIRETVEHSSGALGTSSEVNTSGDPAVTDATVASSAEAPNDTGPTSSSEEVTSSLRSSSTEPSSGKRPDPKDAPTPTTQPASADQPKPETRAPPLADRVSARAAASLTRRDALPLEGGAQVAVAGYQGLWGAELSIGARTPLSSVTAEEEVAIELTSIDLTAAPCVRWAAELSLALCAGARLEWLLASAPRVAEPRSDSAALWGALLGVQLRVPKAARLQLFGAAEAHLRFRKVHLDVEPFGRVLDVPAFGLSFLLGPELAF